MNTKYTYILNRVLNDDSAFLGLNQQDGLLILVTFLICVQIAQGSRFIIFAIVLPFAIAILLSLLRMNTRRHTIRDCVLYLCIRLNQNASKYINKNNWV